MYSWNFGPAGEKQYFYVEDVVSALYKFVCRLSFISEIITFHLCRVQNWVDCGMLGQIKMWPLVLGRSECDWVQEISYLLN